MISASVRTAGPGITSSMMAECREEVEARWRANLNAVMARVMARRPIVRLAKLRTPSFRPISKGALGKDTSACLVE